MSFEEESRDEISTIATNPSLSSVDDNFVMPNPRMGRVGSWWQRVTRRKSRRQSTPVTFSSAVLGDDDEDSGRLFTIDVDSSPSSPSSERSLLLGGGEQKLHTESLDGKSYYQSVDLHGSSEESQSESVHDNIPKEENYKDEKPIADTQSLNFLSLVAIVYFLVCGGAYGTEDLGGSIPPLFALLGMLIIP